VIKYIGSKRRLVPVIGELARRAGAARGLDLFTGTTRVAQDWKRRGMEVWAVDTARYSEALARCFVATDATATDHAELGRILSHLSSLPGQDGYFTATFAHASRYFQPHNARRIDAMRGHIAEHYSGHPLEPVLLTALLLAADRVDSTTGVQMAYLKQWSPRSFEDIELRVPPLLAGPGHAWRSDAGEALAAVPEVDVAYLDPPYNQHRYFTNYHVWETLVAWDAPDHYGVACKRVDAREEATRSVFNDRRRAPGALAQLISSVPAALVVVSCSDEGWVGAHEVAAMAEGRGKVVMLGFESARYVGARIGIHNHRGEKVGRVGRTRNVEYLVVAGEASLVDHVVAGPLTGAGLSQPGS
jgi:adenine-specific DNA-methyltransferase